MVMWRKIGLRIAIPTEGNGGLDNFVSQHFGHAPVFTIFDTETNEVERLPNQGLHRGGMGYPPEHLVRAKVDVMVCGGLGQRAIQMFEQFGIEVYVGASPMETVGAAIKKYQSGKLQMATDENACREHRFRRHEH